MGASRLPNKMLLHLHGYPVVEWVYRRVMQSRLVDKVVFALPDTMQDNVLAFYLESIGAEVFLGSETDLVKRFYEAALLASADEVVRICADNPLICASEIDRLVEFFHNTPCDYAYNHIPRNNQYPDGLGAEICKLSLLAEINTQAVSPEHREHLFNYIWATDGRYIIKTFDPPDFLKHPELKLDVDTIDDYKRLLRKEYQIGMSAKEIITTAITDSTPRLN
jgi:spore coat polysaccharide biosynthesis protein SpsF